MSIAKILAIDDDDMVLAYLQKMLGAQYELIVTTDPAAGIELAALHRPDLILCDIDMPAMSGYEVLARLKGDSRSSDIAVIFLTALDRPDDEVTGLQAGCADYITKPFNAAVVSARVALHLNSARHVRLLESLAKIDALTEIPNRRRFDEVLAAECRRASRCGGMLAVALLDVDFFKQYNDHYGHAMGDRALQAVAAVLRNGMSRPGDVAARYGGEEFALVMSDTSAAGAAFVVDGLRTRIHQLGIPHEKSMAAPCLTISAGIACGIGSELPQPEALLEIADRRLYKAKSSGRNCVIGE